MPQGTIDQHLVDQFSAQVHVVAQQEQNRLRPFMTMQPFSNAERWFYDGLGTIEPRKLSGRVNPVIFSEIDHHRRLITKERWAIALPIDKQDVQSKLGDPQGLYARAIVSGMQRQIDREIVAKAVASAYTGRDGSTVLTAAQDGVLTVDGTGGLDYVDLLELNQNYVDSEVSIEETIMPALTITGSEERDMLQMIELTSGDYNRQFNVEKGKVTQAVGMQIVKFGGAVASPILDVNAGVRDCLSFAPRGMVLGMSQEIDIQVEERSDYHDVTQVEGILSFGVARTEGVRVQILQTTA
jgi:hypothetical protein